MAAFVLSDTVKAKPLCAALVFDVDAWCGHASRRRVWQFHSWTLELLKEGSEALGAQ